jgi:hypothetical protein
MECKTEGLGTGTESIKTAVREPLACSGAFSTKAAKAVLYTASHRRSHDEERRYDHPPTDNVRYVVVDNF